MHKASYEEMNKIVKKYDLNYEDNSYAVADIGSRNINGTYRTLFTKCSYTGFDLIKGKDVDIIMQEEYSTGANNNSFDAILCGQCLEHCTNPFKLIKEMYRICKQNGLCVLIAPFIADEHKYPIDCWRFLPDGFKALFKQTGFTTLETYLNDNDCIGIAKK